MARVARKVDDRKVLKLIRRYLEAGVMADGIWQATAEGTPQGSPLSPILPDVMLDDLDRELWERGHRFVRYADLCRARHKSAYAEARIMPMRSAGVLVSGLAAVRARHNPAGCGVVRGCRGTRAGCRAGGSVRGWCPAAGRGRGLVL